MLINVLQIYLYITVEILSHQQSQVLYARILGRFKYRFIKFYTLIGSDFEHYVYDDEARKMLAEIADSCGSEEQTQPNKRLETLDSLASEDAFQAVLAS